MRSSPQGEPGDGRPAAAPVGPGWDRREPAGAVRPHRCGRAQGGHVLRRDAPPPRHSDEPGRRPTGAVPRRAHRRPGFAVAARGLEDGARARRTGHHGPADYAVPRRGRAARRSDRDPARWPDHRRRLPCRPQGPASPHEGRVRREAALSRRHLPHHRRPRLPRRCRPVKDSHMTTQSVQSTQARFLRDTVVLTRRSLRHIVRSPDTIVTTAITPIAMLLLFVYVFGGAIDTGVSVEKYVDYLLPGILLITIASGV